MPRQHRSSRAPPLRPLQPSEPRNPPDGSPPTVSAPVVRRMHVASACDACRQNKAKCSGERPRCRRCSRNGIECSYKTRPGETNLQADIRDLDILQEKHKPYARVLHLLRYLPEPEARLFMQRFRAGADPTTLWNQFESGDLLVQMALCPENQFRYKFPYRLKMPSEYLHDNPYLTSLIFESASLYASNQHSSPANNSSPETEKNRHQYLMPFHAAQVIDPLLVDVKPSEWTVISDDDMLMRDLLSVFFRCEYVFTMAFQKDLFLQDMTVHQDNFCSQLLVNVVLAYSCVCYPKFQNRVEYWNPKTLLYQFLAEAKRLWEMEIEVSEPRLTTIQAGIIFNVIHNLCGLDEVGQRYRLHSIDLANDLHLFDGPIQAPTERERRGLVYTAWALYSWETLVSFSFMIPPRLTKPPRDPLPDPEEDPQWYGEIMARYPLVQGHSSSCFGQIFKSKCQFRVLMNRFCAQAYRDQGVQVPLEEANELYRELQDWFNNLPVSLRPNAIVLPAHLQLHIYYHHLLAAMYEPLLGTETDQVPHPRKIVAEACMKLYTLVRLYYLRHGFEHMDLFIVIPLMFTGFKCIDAINEHTPAAELEVLRSTLILVANGLYNQRKNHYLSVALYRVIRGKMRPQEAALLKEVLDLKDEEDDESHAMRQAVRSQWPVSIVKKKEDVATHKLANLVEDLKIEEGALSPASTSNV